MTARHSAWPRPFSAPVARGRVALPSALKQCCATEHTEAQRQTFNEKVPSFTAELPEDIQLKLASIVASAPVHENARVLDVGSGTGCLIPHIKASGGCDILAVDLSDKMLAASEEAHGSSDADRLVLGNNKAVRYWRGDICELPNHQGRADVIFMNAVFGNLIDPSAALLKCCSLLNACGHIVISHPLGRAWHRQLHDEHPSMVPHPLPDEANLQVMIHSLPLEIASFVDEDDLYCATLRIPDAYTFPGSPLKLEGPVVEGFQRGSKQMGIPTANVAPTCVEAQLEGHSQGVYFGWAQVQDASNADDSRVYKMVMNYGWRPTIKDGSNVTAEAHIMHSYSGDFYGKTLKLVVTSFIRPEMKLSSIDELIDRIRTDIGIAKAQLDEPSLRDHQMDEFFVT